MSLTLSNCQGNKKTVTASEPTSMYGDHHGLKPVCLIVFSLQNAFNTYRADIGPLRLRGKEQYVFLCI